MNEQQQPIRLLSIEQVPAGPRPVEPLTPEQKAAVEEATRFERVGDYVLVAGYRRFVSPVHKVRR